MAGNVAKAGAKQKGSPLLVFLMVLLVLVGIADAALWGLLIVSFLPDAAGGGSVGAAASSVQTTERERDPLEIYIEDMQKSLALETEALNAYNTAKDKDRDTLYAELNDRIIPLWQQLQEEVGKVSSEDPEVAELHQLYVNFVSERMRVYTMKASDPDIQNDAQWAESEELVQKTNDMVDQCRQRLQTMARERNITL